MMSRALLVAAMGVLLLVSSGLAQEADARTRSDIRAQYGPPEAFAILYYDEPAADGSRTRTSVEQWSYYSAGVEFTFTDEQVVAEDQLELMLGTEAEPAPYDPSLFHAYMSLDEVLAAAGLEHYLGGPVDAIVDGGELFFADRLSWGIKDGELRYIEALSLEAADSSAPVE